SWKLCGGFFFHHKDTKITKNFARRARILADLAWFDWVQWEVLVLFILAGRSPKRRALILLLLDLSKLFEHFQLSLLLGFSSLFLVYLGQEVMTGGLLRS